MQSYEKILESIRSEVSLGAETIRLYRAPGLQALQIGYSVSPNGEPLTSDDKQGDWAKEWVVIGYEESNGDPIFIDTSKEGFPVYTAIHGEGEWNAKQIAVSLEGFGHVLSIVADVARGREHPVALENNPLAQSGKEITLASIPTNTSFWSTRRALKNLWNRNGPHTWSFSATENLSETSPETLRKPPESTPLTSDSVIWRPSSRSEAMNRPSRLE
jgi:hypothetical protein